MCISYESDTEFDIELDTSPIEMWNGCPSTDAYVGQEDWEWQINVSNQALYCADPLEAYGLDPFENLKELYTAKAQIRLAPGSYALPAPGNANVPILLPMCYKTHQNDDMYVSTQSGSVTSSIESTYVWRPDLGTEAEEDRAMYIYSQPVQNSLGAVINFRFIMEYVDYTPQTPGSVSISGRFVEDHSVPKHPTFIHINTDTTGAEKRYHPCLFFDLETTQNITQVEFDGGTINLDLDLPTSYVYGPDTEPYSFVHAFGTYQGTEFDIKSYWQLIYGPEHHHFVRHFAVLFDAPIDNACGLMVNGIDPYAEPQTTGVTAYTIDCELNRLEEKGVVDVAKIE